jgi:hypothetical protein
MGKNQSAPPAPDYTAAATAQGAANSKTALEDWLRQNSNQTTPWGSQTLTADPNSPGGYTRTQTLNPADQARLDQQRALESQLLGAGPAMVSNATDAISKPIDTSGLPSLQGNVNTPGMSTVDFSSLGGPVRNVQGGAIQGSLSNPNDIRSRVENASYNNFASRFDPLAERQGADLRARQANMGGVTTSTGARQQMSDLLQGQNDQRRAAVNDATLQGGNAAAQQLGMENTAGTFANSAQAQEFGQGSQNAALSNSGLDQLMQMMTGQAGFNNNANQQNIQNSFANANLGNSTRAQGIQEQANLQSIPFNQLMAMLSGTQTQAPQFGNIANPGTTPTPIMQGAIAQGQANTAANNANASSSNATTGAMGMLGAAAIAF